MGNWFRSEKLPGIPYSAQDLGVDLASVGVMSREIGQENGLRRITIWNGTEDEEIDKLVYELDDDNNYVPGSVRCTPRFEEIRQKLGFS